MSSSCPGFKAHGINPTRCKRCFKEYNDHVNVKKSDDETKSKDNSTAKPMNNDDSRTFQRSLSSPSTPQKDDQIRFKLRSRINDGPSSLGTESSGVRSRLRPTDTSKSFDGGESQRSAGSISPSGSKKIKIIDAKEIEEVNMKSADNDTNSPDVQFILRVKTARENLDEENITAEATLTPGARDSSRSSYGDRSSYGHSNHELTKVIRDLELKINNLEKDKTELMNKLKKFDSKSGASTGSTGSTTSPSTMKSLEAELQRLKTKLKQLETINNELKMENNQFKGQQKGDFGDSKELKETVLNLKMRLKESESLCEELKEENEQIKKEVQTLEDEFQELHDNYREDQASEFRILKRELESTAKNMRILQFKLKKSDRTIELLENDKLTLEKKLQDLEETTKMDVDKMKMKELETQLSIAKEVSLNLHAEIESLKDERSILERQLNEKNSSTTNHDTTSIKKMNRLSAGSISPSISFESKEKDYETVIRDLYDTMEREKDLQEQLKFSEEESRTMRKKLSTIEQENEILMMQIRKMANRKIGTQDESTDSDELTPEEMKLHLELYEQEVIVLRKKTDELEQENENFQTEIKYLQDKLISQPLTRVEVPEIPEGSPPNVIYEHKIRLLEAEARDLRKKLIDKEKDNESLRTELDVHRRKASASKAVVRTRSLDSEQQVDLKRQLQLVEQEAQILRQKIIALESENEKLSQENKRFQLRLSRKPPPGPVDQMQIENIQLKEELNELKQKCDSFKCDIINNKSPSSSPASTPASSSKAQLFRWNSNDSMNQTENDLIISLKKQLKSKEEESTTLKSRLTKLELELTKSNRDYKKLKDTLYQAKKFMPKVIRETATRMELKDIIKELEDEICLLHNQLKAKDLVAENNQEEVEELKKSNDNLIMEMKNKEAQVDLQMEKLINENTQLKKDFDNEKSKLKSLQTKLDLIKDDKQNVGGLNQFDRLEVLQAEKKELALKCDDLESNLKSQNDLVNELQDKLKSITKLKDELMNNSKLLQTDKEKLEDEIDEYKDKVGKSDKEMKLVNEKLDKVIKENKKLLKDNAALKKEIEQEKHKLASVQQGQQQGLTTTEKENTELKRQIQELILKIDKQTKQFDQEKLVFVENEKKLRNEMTKRIDDAIKDERKELQFELQSLKEECSTHRAKVNELNNELDKARSQCKELQDKLKQQQIQLKREKDDLQSKINDFEGKIKNEQRKREKLEKEYEIQIQGKEKDVTESKEKQLQIERENRRLVSQFEAHEFETKQKISSLEKELTREKENYDEITSKYDLLEKDFVDMKSRLIKEKEVLVEAIETIKKSYDQKLIELKSSKETLQNRQEIWFKEKFNFQAKIQEQENKLEKFCLTETEKNRFKDMLSEKESLLESYRREEKHIKEERDKLRRKCDELMNKISEMERLERASRTLSITGKSQLEKDLQDTKIKLDHSEVAHKAEIAALHAEYEGRMQLMSNEMNELQLQIAKLAKESEYYKMKFNQQSSESSSRRNSLTNSKYKDAVEDMTVQILALKEQLEGVLMENRNLKIQHGADRTTWQVQMAELKTKINQLEEQNLIETTRGSGARSYIKTKMELAWEKERQEQQKLLQDTQKFIQDLRDKLLGIEILRDKERQESRRQLNELKFLMDREHEEAQKQITELQLDLIEMKDVHVKIRSQNERLIRQSPLRTGVLTPHLSDPRAPPRARSLNKKSISLDQQLGQSGLRGASEERIWESDADSARTTPASSYTNLGIGFVGVGYGSRRMNSGYDSETSSFGKGSIGESDASAPAGTTKVKKSIKEKLKSLKKTHSIEETTTGSALADAGLKSLALHPSPFELASSVKGKKKKDSSIKSMITRTLSKTFKSQSEQQLAHPSDDKSFSSPQRVLIGDRNAHRISSSKFESSYSRPLFTSTSTSSSSNTKSSTLTRVRPETTV